MPELERDHVEGACNAPQPFNWKHVCHLKPGHKTVHRVPVGEDDLAWKGEGPVEVVPPVKSRAAYIGGRD